jgi:hypothetical protein
MAKILSKVLSGLHYIKIPIQCTTKKKDIANNLATHFLP